LPCLVDMDSMVWPWLRPHESLSEVGVANTSLLSASIHAGKTLNIENDELSVRSLRSLIVLEELLSRSAPVSAQDLGQSVQLPKQTLHRILGTLTDAGFLQREVDRASYVPGPRLRRMSMGLVASRRGREVRMAVLNSLSGDIGETCNLSLPSDDGMIYLERVETEWPLRIQLPIGSTVPFHCTASGKLYLSTLPQAQLDVFLRTGAFEQNTNNTLTSPEALRAEIERIALAGYSEDNEEFILGMVAISVPVVDLDNRLMAGLAIHAPSARLSMVNARSHIDRLKNAAADLSAVLCDWSE